MIHSSHDLRLFFGKGWVWLLHLGARTLLVLTKVKHEPQTLVFRDTEFSATGICSERWITWDKKNRGAIIYNVCKLNTNIFSYGPLRCAYFHMLFHVIISSASLTQYVTVLSRHYKSIQATLGKMRKGVFTQSFAKQVQPLKVGWPNDAATMLLNNKEQNPHPIEEPHPGHACKRASTLRGDLAEEKAKHIHNREGTETKLNIHFTDGHVQKIESILNESMYVLICLSTRSQFPYRHAYSDSLYDLN